MSNNEQNEVRDFFSRSINAAFSVAAYQMEGGHQYRRPAQDKMSDEARELLGMKKKRDPWGEGWHNGFPPGAGA
jgi:hypothetical protein